MKKRTVSVLTDAAIVLGAALIVAALPRLLGVTAPAAPAVPVEDEGEEEEF